MATGTLAGQSTERLPSEFLIPQREFIEKYWSPKPGDHISLLGTTGAGKTTLGMRLLAGCTKLNPETIGISLVTKPNRGPKGKREDGKRATGDRTVSQLTRELGGRITRTWPPHLRALRDDPAFWTLWPTHSKDYRADKARHRALFQDVILDSYNKGRRWLFADEVFTLVDLYGLEDELIHVWSKGRSLECGIIAATQRPASVPLWMYSMATHLFLFYDRDLRARKRYGEIGGFDPKRLERLVAGLGEFEALYLYPAKKIMAVITPD